MGEGTLIVGDGGRGEGSQQLGQRTLETQDRAGFWVLGLHDGV